MGCLIICNLFNDRTDFLLPRNYDKLKLCYSFILFYKFTNVVGYVLLLI